MYAKTYAEIQQCQKEGRCIQCGEEFTDSNVFTDAGWREVAISCLCERCFDGLFEGMDEDD